MTCFRPLPELWATCNLRISSSATCQRRLLRLPWQVQELTNCKQIQSLPCCRQRGSLLPCTAPAPSQWPLHSFGVPYCSQDAWRAKGAAGPETWLTDTKHLDCASVAGQRFFQKQAGSLPPALLCQEESTRHDGQNRSHAGSGMWKSPLGKTHQEKAFILCLE